MAFHLRSVVLPDDERRDLYVAGGRITLEPLAAETVVDGGWLLPGLVDVHTHPGAELPGDPLDEALLRRHGERHRDAGVTLLRVPGAAGRLPAWFGEDVELPRVFGAGPWLAAAGRFFAGWARHPGLVAAAHEAGVTVLAGTDSLGDEGSPHGRVADEIRCSPAPACPPTPPSAAARGPPGAGSASPVSRRAHPPTWSPTPPIPARTSPSSTTLHGSSCAAVSCAEPAGMIASAVCQSLGRNRATSSARRKLPAR